MAKAMDAESLYAIGSGPSSGCDQRQILIALKHIKMLISFIQHASCTSFLYMQFIYYVMAQAADAD